MTADHGQGTLALRRTDSIHALLSNAMNDHLGPDCIAVENKARREKMIVNLDLSVCHFSSSKLRQPTSLLVLHPASKFSPSELIENTNPILVRIRAAHGHYIFRTKSSNTCPRIS